MPPTPIRLSSPTVHCPSAPDLAAFYAELTGGSVTFANPAWAIVDGPGGRIDFQTVGDYAAPTWPGGASPIRMHLDFFVTELAAATDRAIAIGGTREEEQPNPEHCIVLRDPVGNPFCLTTWDTIG